MTPLHRAVVAAQDGDGSVVYEFGWAESVSFEAHREHSWQEMSRSTVVEWATPPKRSATYPTPGEWPAVPMGRRSLPAARVELPAGS